MKYFLTFIVDEPGMENASPEEMREGIEHWSAFDEEAARAGALIACEPLENSSTATIVRVAEDGDRLVSDGRSRSRRSSSGASACSSASAPRRRSSGRPRFRRARARSRSGG
jgi:hypothetical protein